MKNNGDYMDTNAEIQKIAELNEKTHNILEKLGVAKIMDERKIVLFDKVIKEFGRGAHILIPRTHINHKATVIVSNKKEGTDK